MKKSFIAVAALIFFGASSVALANDKECHVDVETGYMCCPHPLGGTYCDPATGPDDE